MFVKCTLLLLDFIGSCTFVLCYECHLSGHKVYVEIATMQINQFSIFCLLLEAVSGAGCESLPGGTALFYQTPSGLLPVLASPSTSAGTLPPDGYILSVPGTSAFALQRKVLPGQSELSICCLLGKYI